LAVTISVGFLLYLFLANFFGKFYSFYKPNKSHAQAINLSQLISKLV